ncbi:MAG TPA: hypothetical protein VFY23_04235 [Candidatus Limnocylindrales bacterium]|nr:hypothetical protein [Candidatus Limnocylindrales bacterium]
MKRLIGVLAGLVLVAGCSGSAGTSLPPTTPDMPPTGTPSGEPTCPDAGCPESTPAAVSARLTFDGEACTYTGPTVVPSPASLRLEFVPTDEGFVASIAQVKSTVTREEADRVNADQSYGAAPGRKAPEWMLPGYWAAYMGTGTLDFAMEAKTVGGVVYDQFVISCVENPWAADKPADTIENRTTAAIVKVTDD